ncbi:TetR/AcrR family transcriptional regulator [Quadrisphaera setariae]|uniref:TetR/AcrR family transcriptional regulator n=1 Tax=Quadrisphaera setariae TaxID=2593304 RepID=UPI0016506BEB|nr:TetR family transcriptional regulator [Quadrisphaera setariae]
MAAHDDGGGSGRRNPGPSAAARNRAALLAAARRLFDELGADVPMSRLAAEAGVGQAVLYRVFPDRASAVWEVFTEDLTALEALADAGDLPALLGEVSRSAARSTGFLQVVAGHLGDPRLAEVGERFAAALVRCRERTAPERRPRRDLTTGDLRLAVQMVTGALVTTPRGERLGVARRSWDLLGIPVDLDDGPR